MVTRSFKAPTLDWLVHPERVYKDDTRAPNEVPRLGDFAEITHSCCREETGMIVQVVNQPHWVVVFCADCHQKLKDWIVQVEPVRDWEKWLERNPPPYFYPISWLKRWTPDKIAIER